MDTNSTHGTPEGLQGSGFYRSDVERQADDLIDYVIRNRRLENEVIAAAPLAWSAGIKLIESQDWQQRAVGWILALQAILRGLGSDFGGALAVYTALSREAPCLALLA